MHTEIMGGGGGAKNVTFTNYKREEGGGKENGMKLKRPVITMKIQSPMKIVFITVCCRFLLDSVETQSLKTNSVLVTLKTLSKEASQQLKPKDEVEEGDLEPTNNCDEVLPLPSRLHHVLHLYTVYGAAGWKKERQDSHVFTVELSLLEVLLPG